MRTFCLEEGVTARLIDRGWPTLYLMTKAEVLHFELQGYMCPEYSRNKYEGTPCPYIAAYDVYSIGVVMVELILGCLIGGQSARNGMQFKNAFAHT